MNKENAAFLIGGLAFGALLGVGVYHTIATRPDAGASAPAAVQQVPAPAAGTQAAVGDGSSAPMMSRIEDLKSRVDENPGDLEAIMELVRLYHGVGMVDQAGQWYERAVAQRPDDAVLVSGLAHLYHDASRWEQAIRVYERALALRPGDPDLTTDMGICYRGLGQPERALTLFRNAHAAHPDHWKSLYNQVVVYAFDLQKFDDAEAALLELERRHPDAQNVDALRREVANFRVTSQGPS